eukprot:1075026-Rhodomonas_salina.1
MSQYIILNSIRQTRTSSYELAPDTKLGARTGGEQVCEISKTAVSVSFSFAGAELLRVCYVRTQPLYAAKISVPGDCTYCLPCQSVLLLFTKSGRGNS